MWLDWLTSHECHPRTSLTPVITTEAPEHLHGWTTMEVPVEARVDQSFPPGGGVAAPRFDELKAPKESS